MPAVSAPQPGTWTLGNEHEILYRRSSDYWRLYQLASGDALFEVLTGEAEDMEGFLAPF